MQRYSRLWDNLGISASTVCLIHCMILPTMLVIFPTATLAWLADDAMHLPLLGILILPAAIAAVTGFLAHKHLSTAVVMAFGLGAVTIGTFSHEIGLPHSWEVPVMVLGSLTLIAAHWTNRNLCKACPTCAHEAHENETHSHNQGHQHDSADDTSRC